MCIHLTIHILMNVQTYHVTHYHDFTVTVDARSSGDTYNVRTKFHYVVCAKAALTIRSHRADVSDVEIM